MSCIPSRVGGRRASWASFCSVAIFGFTDFFQWMQSRGERANNPAAGLRLTRPRKSLPRFLSEEQMANLLIGTLPSIGKKAM